MEYSRPRPNQGVFDADEAGVGRGGGSCPPGGGCASWLGVRTGREGLCFGVEAEPRAVEQPTKVLSERAGDREEASPLSLSRRLWGAGKGSLGAPWSGRGLCPQEQGLLPAQRLAASRCLTLSCRAKKGAARAGAQLHPEHREERRGPEASGSCPRPLG